MANAKEFPDYSITITSRGKVTLTDKNGKKIKPGKSDKPPKVKKIRKVQNFSLIEAEGSCWIFCCDQWWKIC